LWNETISKFPEKDGLPIDWENLEKIDILKQVRDKIDELQQQEEIKHKSFNWRGRQVKIHDVASNVVRYIDKFSSVGDAVSSLDPIHAGLPWAAFKFLLGVASADIKNNELVLVGLESTARCIDRCAIYEHLYLRGRIAVAATSELEKNIQDLYSKILTFQIMVSKRFKELGFSMDSACLGFLVADVLQLEQLRVYSTRNSFKTVLKKLRTTRKSLNVLLT